MFVMSVFLSAAGVSADEFYQDMQALAGMPNRLCGTDNAEAARKYITGRLLDAGVKSIHEIEMPTWQLEVERCEIVVGDSVFELAPLRPDVLIPPVTPPQGLSGPLIYAGHGELEEYGSSNVEGAIVALEYDCGKQWLQAFSLGAAAVVFLGDDKSGGRAPKYVGIPANYVRLYAAPAVVRAAGLRSDRESVTIFSHVTWKKTISTSIVAMVPGTAPTSLSYDGKPEAIVLSAYFDTYGEVPTISPGARGAANVAALLDAVSWFAEKKPVRDIVCLFLDNRARYHQGARAFYTALMTPEKSLARYHEGHREEMHFVENIVRELSRGAPRRQSEMDDVQKEIVRCFQKAAEHFASDVKMRRAQARLFKSDANGENDSLIALLAQLDNDSDIWNQARKALAEEAFGAVDTGAYSMLERDVLDRFVARRRELNLLLRIDEQQETLRSLLGGHRVVLHAAYNFSGDGATWGVISGDDTEDHFRNGNPNGDDPMYYQSIFKEFRSAAARVGHLSSLNSEMLSDPITAHFYIPGHFASDGIIAGTYGIYNISMMTCHDIRIRDGHPSDRIENLNWRRIRKQAREAHALLDEVAKSPGLSLPRVFFDYSLFLVPRWQRNRALGNYVGLSVTGSIAEDRPATDAVLGVWPTSYWGENRNWVTPSVLGYIPGFERFMLEQVDGNGNYSILGGQREFFDTCSVLGVLFDDYGQVTAISNDKTIGDMKRVNLFPARGYVVPCPLLGPYEHSSNLDVMEARSNAKFRPALSLSGGYEETAFFYVSTYSPVRRIKIFRRVNASDIRGPILLGSSLTNPYGEGVDIKRFETSLPVDRLAAGNLWYLNEARLGILRERSVTDVALEVLHGKAQKMFSHAEQEKSVLARLKLYTRSLAYSKLAYEPVRQVMTDLIDAVVLLLLLAIPFAFILERLIFSFTGIYGRVAGFSGLFAVTFMILYFLHPGFSIAATPLIVFLAVIIILLSSFVIWIMARKFRDELMAFQGKASRLHAVEISRFGAITAAISMGMFTMRRRPIRTVLTIFTTLMLTFTIMCFASFTSRLGVRSTYLAPHSNLTAAYQVRDINYAPLKRGLLTAAGDVDTASQFVAAQWWLQKEAGANNSIGIARLDNGKADFLEGALGVDPRELSLWPELCELLEGESVSERSKLLEKGVFVPVVVQRRLQLHRGDTVMVNGVPLLYAGVFDGNELQRLRHLDDKSIIPVNFTSQSYGMRTGANLAISLKGAGDSQTDFDRLSPNQILITSADFVKRLGGAPHLLTIYRGEEQGTERGGQTLAELTATPVWANLSSGVYRMVFTRLAQVGGGMALLIPIMLGGFIIFGTLLGSINDRQREIYTFAALGLGPVHVGSLFFAEALVYAVVGGMGGEICAQAFAHLASWLAGLGYIEPLSINFSSTQSLGAIGVVMLTVFASALYPAIKASRSANPGIQRYWRMPKPEGDLLELTFPFTVSSHDIAGVVSFLGEFFRSHNDAGLGRFAARAVGIQKVPDGESLQLIAELSLAPFDLGISQHFTLTAVRSEIEGIDEVKITARRMSGTRNDWFRANKPFLNGLRHQFLIWRTLDPEVMEEYRMRTVQEIGSASDTHSGGSA